MDNPTERVDKIDGRNAGKQNILFSTLSPTTLPTDTEGLITTIFDYFGLGEL